MRDITMNRSDSIETLLPAVESAMEAGDVCQIHNINYLGVVELAALRRLAKAVDLLDADTGKICHALPGFCLVGIDEYGTARILV
jgi:hypothetical protein